MKHLMADQQTEKTVKIKVATAPKALPMFGLLVLLVITLLLGAPSGM